MSEITKNLNSLKDSMFIYIELHIPDDTAVHLNKIKVDDLMSSRLDERQELISEEKFNNSLELIYKIQKPVLDSDDYSLEFFELLEFLFNSLSSFSPHFTQVGTSED
jgi:hypothetical protein